MREYDSLCLSECEEIFLLYEVCECHHPKSACGSRLCPPRSSGVCALTGETLALSEELFQRRSEAY